MGCFLTARPGTARAVLCRGLGWAYSFYCICRAEILHGLIFHGLNLSLVICIMLFRFKVIFVHICNFLSFHMYLCHGVALFILIFLFNLELGRTTSQNGETVVRWT